MELILQTINDFNIFAYSFRMPIKFNNMESTLDITLDYAAPISIGHRLEVNKFAFFEIDRKGRETITEIENFHLKDLNTGIEYGMNKHFDKIKLISFYNETVLPLDVRKDLRLLTKTTGTVARCRVLSVRNGDNWQMQTRLILENIETEI